MTKIEELKAAVLAATQSEMEMEVGESACFRKGNRVALTVQQRIDPDEFLVPTLAELWPTADDTDIADARLIVLLWNNAEALIEAAEALQAALSGNEFDLVAARAALEKLK